MLGCEWPSLSDSHVPSGEAPPLPWWPQPSVWASGGGGGEAPVSTVPRGAKGVLLGGLVTKAAE